MWYRLLTVLLLAVVVLPVEQVPAAALPAAGLLGGSSAARLSPGLGTTATRVGLWCLGCGWRGHTNVSGAAVVPMDESGWAGVR